MTTREREKATHGIGVVRQEGWLHARRSGRWVERGNRREREREREGNEEGIAINGETRTQEGNARKKKRRGGRGRRRMVVGMNEEQ